MTLAAIRRELDGQWRRLEMDRGRLEQIEDDLTRLRALLEEYRVTVEELTEALQVFQTLEGAWHRQLEERISSLISRGLSLVFEEPLKLVLETKTRGELSAMDFKLVQTVDGVELVTDIVGSKGGGVVAVVSFLLRLFVLLLSKPPLRHVLLLDESFAHVSKEYVPNLARLLRQLVNETGVQIILVSHEPLFGEHADVVYEISQNRQGESQARRINQQEMG